MEKDQEATPTPAPKSRPSWLMPGWVALTAGPTGRPIYVDARTVTGIEDHPDPDPAREGATVAVVCVALSSRFMVSETPEEVMRLLGNATA